MAVGSGPEGQFHVLRHTFASIMLEAGEPVATVARWLDHSSPAITLGYYAHFTPEAGSKGRTAIDVWWGEGEISVPIETPQILPRAHAGLVMGGGARPLPQKVAMDRKVEGVGGLRKC